MSTWNIAYSNDNGVTWVSDGTISRPNIDLSDTLTSTEQVITLADGSEAYQAPETKSVKGSIPLDWIFDDGTLRTKIRTYITNCTLLKITTHLSTTYIGKFTSIQDDWLVGQSPDVWNLSTVFKLQA